MKQNLKVFESFAGYGSQRMALRNLGIDFESVGISEIDIPAILSYASIHDGLDKVDDTFAYPSKEEMIEYLEQRNIGLDFKTKKVKLPKNLIKLQQIYRATVLSKCFGDISLIDPSDLPDMDLFTYSFPCTDISIAGQRQGVIKGQTRSGLLYECEKIIEVKRPKYLLMENVKNLVGKKFKGQFDEWLDYLESLGYTNYWKVLNAKDYGVPQNRERVFVVSILEEVGEKEKSFTMPHGEEGCLRLRDILEDEVQQKYFIDKPFKLTEKGKQMIDSNSIVEVAHTDSSFSQNSRVYGTCGISPTIAARDWKDAKKVLIEVANLTTHGHRANKAVYSEEGISPTLASMNGGNRQPKIIELPNQDISYCIDANYHKGTSIEGYLNKKRRQLVNDKNNMRIRKLTPKECWRLMGCSDEDFEKAKLFNSDSQLYKQAGNSIVVNVLEGIFANMFCKE